MCALAVLRASKGSAPPPGGAVQFNQYRVACCLLPVTCFSLAAQCHYYSRKSVDSAHCTLTDTCSHRHRSPILTVPRGLRVIVWPSQRLTVTRTPAPCVPCEAMKASPASDFDVAHKQGIPTGAREHTHARARGGGGGAHTRTRTHTHTRARPHGRTRTHTVLYCAVRGACGRLNGEHARGLTRAYYAQRHGPERASSHCLHCIVCSCSVSYSRRWLLGAAAVALLARGGRRSAAVRHL